MMKRFLFLVALTATLWTSPASGQSPTNAKPLLGFSPEQATAEYQLESKFDSYLKADHLRDWMKRLSARPHHVGSPYDKDNAEWIAALFKSWGYDTRIDVSYVLFPTPKLR